MWAYERPHETVVGIGEHLAFYPARVDAIEECNLLHDSSAVSTASIFELYNARRLFRISLSSSGCFEVGKTWLRNSRKSRTRG